MILRMAKAVVGWGTPDAVARSKQSRTAPYLRAFLDRARAGRGAAG
jgi:hypothetical protein